MKSKIIAAMIAAAMVLSLSSCGKKPADEPTAPTTVVSDSVVTQTQTAPETSASTTATTTEAPATTTTTTTTTTTAAPAKLSPADQLLGSWDFVKGETEAEELTTDYQECRLTFSDDGTAEYLQLLKYDPDDPYDDATFKEYEMPYEIQDAALYDGCPNEDWSVQIFTKENGVEYYATVLPDGTLKFMQFTYYDGEEYPFMFLADFVRAE